MSDNNDININELESQKKLEESNRELRKLLEEEKKTTDKDKEYLFNELRKYEKQIPELQQHKEFLKFLSKYAPNELEEVKLVAKQRERLSRKPTKKKFNDFIKY